MSFGTEWRYFFGEYAHRYSSRNARPQRLLGGAALACVALACGWTVCVNLAGGDADFVEVANTRGDKLDLAGSRGDKLAVATPVPPAAPNTTVALFDPRYLGAAPGTFAKSAALQPDKQPAPSPSTVRNAQRIPAPPASNDRIAQSAASPAPPPQPPQIRTASLRDRAQIDRVAANKPADAPSIFEKLFGKPSPLTLAYAAPNDGGLGAGRSVAAGRYERDTAVYDISAHVVYMPDGTALEAHSGLGSLLDDPRHADERNRGVTPPNVYDLELREEPFHGVRALRLIPEDEGKVFGRSGFLAHSFMLGPNGDSNGCVSFKDYEAFLRAYLDQRIKRLAVVTRLE
jgi:hypothetical protein